MDTRFETKRTFAAILQEKDPELFDTLEAIKQKGFEEWVPLLSFDLGSHAGYPHLLNVERNANKMIPDHIKTDFSPGEIFLLLSSIFLHDIGKLLLITPKDKQAHPTVRHQEESRKIIEECWAELVLPDERIAKYCALISWYHGVENPFASDKNIRNYQMFSLEPYGRLRIPFISAILRIADETENVWTRSLQEYLYHRIARDSSIQMVKGVRRFVEDVEFCLDGECIILHIPALYQIASEPNDSLEFKNDIQVLNKTNILDRSEIDTLNRMKKVVNDMLSHWGDLLKEEGIAFNHVFFKHRNKLLVELVDRKANPETKPVSLNAIFEKGKQDKRPGVQELLDAIVKMSLGSMGHDAFHWKSLEAKVGYILTEREKWIVKQMNFITSDCYITFYPNDLLKINLNREKIKEIYEAFGCDYSSFKK